MQELLDHNIDVFATSGTHKAMKTESHYCAEIMTCSNGKLRYKYELGNFSVTAFKVKHDAAEPCGFVIEHPEMGKTLFMTDTMYSDFTFVGIHNMILECNYSEDIMKRRLRDKQFLRDRIMSSHMSLETCKEFIRKTDTTKLNNIVLIHLSDGNSHEHRFKQEIEEESRKTVTVASAGMNIEFNQRPF